MFVSKSLWSFPSGSSCPVSCQSLYSDTAQTRMKEASVIFVNSKEIEVGWRISLKRNLFRRPDGPSNSKQNMQIICSHFFFFQSDHLDFTEKEVVKAAGTLRLYSERAAFPFESRHKKNGISCCSINQCDCRFPLNYERRISRGIWVSLSSCEGWEGKLRGCQKRET